MRKIAREILLKLRNPSRYILERKIFPKIKNKRTLLVGVAYYTADYPKRLKENHLWTIDINPEAAEFGAKKHIIGNVVYIDKYFPENFFDVIILFGVFGYGLDKIEEAEKTMRNCARVLKKKGQLIIQWTNIQGHNQINPRKLKNFDLYTPRTLYGFKSGHRTTNKAVFEFLIKK